MSCAILLSPKNSSGEILTSLTCWRTHIWREPHTDETGQSEWQNTVESCMADSQCQQDSDASVMNDKNISRDVYFDEDMGVSMEVDVNRKRDKPHQKFQVEGFYLNSEEHKGSGDPFSNGGGLTQDTLYALGGLDMWLLPLRFSDENSFEYFVYLQRSQPNGYYKNVVKYLQLALNSIPSASVALLPLIQLLLIGCQVDEALNRLEKQCSDYSLESLLEMIASHLDATDADYSTWSMFSLCFFKLSHYENDCMYACPIQNEDGHRQHCSSTKTPKIFTDGALGKSWRLRCRWWLPRHFSKSKLESEIEAGDLQLLTYKAACPSSAMSRGLILRK